MSTEHKRPLYAFAILALACALFVGNGLRSDAIGGVLRADDRVLSILSVLPPVEEKAAPVAEPTKTATSRLRMVSARTAGASATAPALRPNLAAAKATGPGKSAGTKASKRKKSAQVPVTKQRRGSDRHAKQAKPSWATPGHSARPGHQGPPRGKSDQHRQGAGHGKSHGKAHGKSHRKASRDGHQSRDRGPQHRPGAKGKRGAAGHQGHSRGKSDQRRQERGHHGMQPGKKQGGKHGGPGRSARSHRA